MNFTMPPYAPVPFSFVVTIAWIAVFLVIGMVLRAVFPVFKRFLIPACIIGGVTGFLFESFGLLDMTGFEFNNGISGLIVYHLFNLTWVYLGLRVPVKDPNQKSSNTKMVIFYAGFISAVMYASNAFAMMATTLLHSAGIYEGPATIGSLVSYGFLAGPGQTLTIANVWTTVVSFTGLPDFALAGGAMGFAVAIVFGVISLNIIARKKKLNLINNPSEEEECGFYNDCTPTQDAGQQTTSATSIDVLAWHLALGLGTYLLSYIFAICLFIVLPQEAKIFVWSMFFVFGAIFGMLVRTIIAKLGKQHLLCAGITNRISNTIVDFMVCATFITITVGNIVQYMLPFLVATAVSTVIVTAGTWYYTSRLKSQGVETFAYMYGTMTGTVSTAFILLRLVDPANKAQAPMFMAMSTVVTFPLATFLTPFLFHLEPVYGVSPWIPCFAFLGMALVGAILAKICTPELTKTAWEPEA